MSGLHPQIGVATYSYHRRLAAGWPLSDLLRHLAGRGVRHIMLHAFQIPDRSPEAVRDLRRLIEDLDMRVQLGLGAVTVPGQPVAQTLDRVRPLLDLAADLGAWGCWQTTGWFRSQPGIDVATEMARALEAAHALVPEAAARRLVLAQENHADFRSTELRQLVEAVGSPWFGVNFDTGNPVAVFEDPLEAAERLAPFVRSTHMRDLAIVSVQEMGGSGRFGYQVLYTRLGQGLVPLPAIVRLLRQARPDLVFTIESIPGFLDEDWCVQADLAYLDRLLRDLDAA